MQHQSSEDGGAVSSASVADESISRPPRQNGVHGQEVGDLLEVVDAQDVRPAATPCATAASVPPSRSRGGRP